MALNKYMHPRNIYKTPPDFSKLAKEYEEFSEIAIVDVSGKISIDFKNPDALRVLTKCLLKSDFNIDIEIPKDRLVPTLPLRLNYILWIEDLLNAIHKNDLVMGLDIGTGACAIYPILASIKNKWHMIGTESDEGSLKTAKNNIRKNKLQDMIKLIRNETSSVLDVIFQEDSTQKFCFCMCNPPFYSNFQDLWESRSPARPPPKNGFTGSPQELITEGGELQFCKRIIEESKKYKDNILIFTTMVGHKYNLKELVLELKADCIKYTTTEFCQGRVTRWGLAWTYQDFDIGKLIPPRDKTRKKNIPILFTLEKPPQGQNDLEQVLEKFKNILQNLKMSYNIVDKRKHEVTLDFKALVNTWSNQRRKRRLMKRSQNDDETKKLKLDTEDIKETGSMDNNSATISVESNSEIISIDDDKATSLNSSLDCNPGSAKDVIPEDKNSEKDTDVSHDKITEPIVHAVVEIKNRDNKIYFEIEYLDGSAGKEGLHQIIQYIKNNWK